MNGTARSAQAKRYFVLGLFCFGASTLLGLVFPATYRGAAFVTVNAPEADAEPLRLSRRIEEITIDSVLLDELRQELGADAGEGARAAWSLRRAIGIASADGRTFEVSFTDSNRKRAQALSDHVARRVASRAPDAFRDGHPTGPVTAALTLESARPSWPAPGQSAFFLFGAIAAAVAWTFAEASRRSTGRVTPDEAADSEPRPVAQAPFRSPATTIGLGSPYQAANAPPAEPQPPRTERTFPTDAHDPRKEGADGAPKTPRTDPMLPPPTPAAAAAAAVSPGSGFSPAVPDTTGVSPGPLPLRRSTLILGSPIAPAMPTPLPTKPTPTSIFRPSPLPPAPTAVSPSSKPPPPGSVRSLADIAIDRAGARYSYVSTPVPAPVNPHVALRDAPMDLAPGLRPEVHKPWRRQLFSLGVAQCFVTAVCSVGEARREKARFAVELALCLAETGHARVLMVEADLAEPELRAILGLTLVEGDSLAGQLATNSDQARPWSVLRCKEKLHALVQEKPALSELVLGEQFRDCIIGLSTAYDFVVLNAPPIETGLVGRTTGWVDGAVIVTRDETSSGVEKAKAALGLKQFLKIYTPGATVR